MDFKDVVKLESELVKPEIKRYCPKCKTELCSAGQKIITDFPKDNEFNYFAYERGEPVFQGTYKFIYIECTKCKTKVEISNWYNADYMNKKFELKDEA